MGKAIQDLRKEHDAILHVLEIVDKMLKDNTKDDSAKLPSYKEVVYFLKIFADKCHHGKEEKYLFREMADRGVYDEDGLMEVLQQEHNQGRELIAQMDKALSAGDFADFKTNMTGYGYLIRSHIRKENEALFARADDFFDFAEQDRLFEVFEKYEENVIGHGVHEELHELIHKWEEEF